MNSMDAKMFRVAVTVRGKYPQLKYWNNIPITLTGDPTDLLNLQKQLNHIKQEVNKDMNKRGLALRDVEVKIKFL